MCTTAGGWRTVVSTLADVCVSVATAGTAAVFRQARPVDGMCVCLAQGHKNMNVDGSTVRVVGRVGVSTVCVFCCA